MSFMNPFGRKNETLPIPAPAPAPVVAAAASSDYGENSDRIIWGYVKMAAALGVAGSFGMHIDLPFLVILWGFMIRRLAGHHGIEMDQKDAMKIATALMGASTAIILGAVAAETYFKMTIVGIPAALTLNAAVNAAFTCAVGVVVSTIFGSESDGTKGGTGPGNDPPSNNPPKKPDRLNSAARLFGEFLAVVSVEFIKRWIRNGGSPHVMSKMLERDNGKDPRPQA